MEYCKGGQGMKKRLVKAYLSKDKPSYFVIEITGATLADLGNLLEKTDKLFDSSFELKNNIINLQVLFDEGFIF